MAPRASLRAVSPTRGTASLAPHFDVTAHIVLDDFGKAGRVYRETGEEDTTLGSVVDDLLTGLCRHLMTAPFPAAQRANQNSIMRTRSGK